MPPITGFAGEYVVGVMRCCIATLDEAIVTENEGDTLHCRWCKSQLSTRTLWGITSPRGPIPCIRVGNRSLYSYDVLRDWVAKNVGQSFSRAS